MPIESVLRIEPALLEEPTAGIADVLAELSAAAATLGRALHPCTAASLAGVVRIMNTYYSNFIEGHDTRPRDIERALAGEFDQMKGGATSSSKPPPMSACRPRSTGSRRKALCLHRHRACSCNGCTANSIATRRRPC
jgi:hypothetical protein